MPIQRRDIIRRAILVLCAAGVTALLVRHGLEPFRELRARLHMRELQRRCAEYAPPPDLMVYDDDPALYRKLRQSDRQLVGLVFPDGRAGRFSVARGFAPWTEFCRLSDPFIKLNPLFLHERRCGEGRMRLAVVLNMLRVKESEHPAIRLASFTVQPVTPWSYPGLAPRAHEFRVTDLPKTAPVRFYAGQFDPKEANRLTIDFEIGGEPGIISGEVQDDGTIALRIVSGPGEIVDLSPSSAGTIQH